MEDFSDGIFFPKTIKCSLVRHHQTPLFKIQGTRSRNRNIKSKLLALLCLDYLILPAAYMTASIMEEIHATSLYVALKMSWMSLKKTVIALGNA